MNRMKKIFAIMIAAVLFFSLQVPSEALAASKKPDVPDEVRIYGAGWDSYIISVTNIDYGDTAVNIKTSSKNIHVKLTEENWNSENPEENRLSFSSYSTKEGTYTVIANLN